MPAEIAWSFPPPPLRVMGLLEDEGTDDDAAILCRLDAGTEEEIFSVLVRRYQDRVFRLALSVLGPGNELEAEDVAQEVFLQVHRKLHTFRSESRFSTWLYRLAYRKAVDAQRRARHRYLHLGDDALVEGADPSVESSPLERALADARRRALHRALAQLRPRQRSAVHLHYWLGCAVEEIAALHGTSPGTVKSDLHRARARLAPLVSRELLP